MRIENETNTSGATNDNEYIIIDHTGVNRRRLKVLQDALNKEGLSDEFIFTYTLEDMCQIGLKEFIEISLIGGKEILALFLYVDPLSHIVAIDRFKYITTTHSDLCSTIRRNTEGEYILASIRHINESILDKSFYEVLELFGIDIIPNNEN